MAYVSPEDKAKIVAAVKKVMPKGWKATFAVRNYSTIVCTIRSAPFDLADVIKADRLHSPDEVQINKHYVESYAKTPEMVEALTAIIKALDTDNYNNSDIMTDYFDVGHYVELRFGSWDKPFKNSSK